MPGSNFWLQFAIQEALAVAAAYVASAPALSAAQKQALENFITAGQGVAAVL